MMLRIRYSASASSYDLTIRFLKDSNNLCFSERFYQKLQVSLSKQVLDIFVI